MKLTCNMHLFSILAVIIVAQIFAASSKVLKYESLLDTSIDNKFHIQQKRDTNIEGSGLECADSESQTCTALESGFCRCLCKPGYHQVKADGANTLVCTRIKIFGGKITFTEEYDPTNAVEIKNSITVALSEIYGGNYFMNVDVVELTSGSIIATYELRYQNHKDVDKSYVINQFDRKYNCSYPTNTPINSLSGTTNLTIDVKESCRTVVDEAIICNYSYKNYCDESSTTCIADAYGYVACPCKPYYYEASDISTICLAEICISDSQCNFPFGSCVLEADGANYCSCFWGFSGDYCNEPWLFTLTVVASACGLIIIILLIGLAAKARKAKKLKSRAITRTPYVVADTDLKYGLSDFQPGALRAKVPSSSHHNRSLSEEAKTNKSSRSNASKTETNGIGNGHTNPTFKSSQQNISSFMSSKRSPKDREPSDYF